LAEKFVSIQTEKGARSAVQLFGEMLLTTLTCFFIVSQWQWLRTTLLTQSELTLLALLLINILLGNRVH
jgi:hypothetical protein